MAMMHGLGDVKKPLPESAAIVEELVHQQVILSLIRNISSLFNEFIVPNQDSDDEY